MALTHHAYWNVEGPGCFALHKAFEEHYAHLFHAIDEIAERVRALDACVLGGLRAFAKEAGLDEFPYRRGRRRGFRDRPDRGHEKALADLVALRDAAGSVNDLETPDPAIGRSRWHQKTTWMLKSCLKTT